MEQKKLPFGSKPFKMQLNVVFFGSLLPIHFGFMAKFTFTE